MCALVLALRKIPIYAPGGGDSVLGSSDKPTYSVTVTDAEAAANREAFAKTKEGKRLVPHKKSEEAGEAEAVKVPAKGPSSGFEAPRERDSATPSPLRYRLSTRDETSALNTLNTRHPAADTADDPSDLIETEVPSSGSSTPRDLHRSADLEEVRGLLHRQSTRGKRKPVVNDDPPRIPSISDVSTGPKMDIDYRSYPPQTSDPYRRQSGRYYDMRGQQQQSQGFGGQQQQQQQQRTTMQSLPEIDSPIPGNGNAFAQQAKRDQEQQQQQQQQQQRRP